MIVTGFHAVLLPHPDGPGCRFELDWKEGLVTIKSSGSEMQFTVQEWREVRAAVDTVFHTAAALAEGKTADK